MLRWFPNSKLLLGASLAVLPAEKSSKLSPVRFKTTKIIFSHLQFNFNSENQNSLAR
jgi:hypothetical protein